MWLPLFPQILLAAILLLVPGLTVALSLRFRPFEALALAPALSVGVVVVTATGTPFLGIPFGALPVGVTTALLATVGFFVGRLSPGQQKNGQGSSVFARSAPIAAFLVAAALLAWRTLQVIGTPGSISQTYDAVFHLNSVRFALDTGHASSLTIGAMTGGGFYPAGWNAVATLVAATTGTDVPIAVNITSVVLASVFWPLSCLLMTIWIVGHRPAATITAGIVCASLGAFPLLMLDFGVLYPNLLAISILPAGIALAARITRTGAVTPRPGWSVFLALTLALAGLVVSHPTTFMAWLVWTLPMVGFRAYKSGVQVWKDRAAKRRQLYLSSAFIGIYCIVFLVLWIFLRPPEEASFWGPYHTVPQALGEALLVAPMDLAPAWLAAPLALLGLLSCLKRAQRYAWAGAAFIIFSAVFVVVSGFPISPIRNFLAGVWYNDSYRVAALLPVGAVLMAALGVSWADSQFRGGPWGASGRALLRRLTGGPSEPGQRLLQFAGIGALTIGAIALGQQGSMKSEAAQASTRYSVNDESPLVSADELALFTRLPQTVPADSTLIGNPYTGAALSYALAGRKAAQLHILSYVSPELQEIYNGLGAVASDPKVCAAVEDEDTYYVLDFGPKEVHGGNHTPPGLNHLENNPGVQLIDSQGEAKLYRIIACGG